jgi:hypothetical protein
MNPANTLPHHSQSPLQYHHCENLISKTASVSSLISILIHSHENKYIYSGGLDTLKCIDLQISGQNVALWLLFRYPSLKWHGKCVLNVQETEIHRHSVIKNFSNRNFMCLYILYMPHPCYTRTSRRFVKMHYLQMQSLSYMCDRSANQWPLHVIYCRILQVFWTYAPTSPYVFVA